MKHFFFKELLNNAYFVNGAPVPFEPLGNNRGVIALDDTQPEHKGLIAALNTASDKHRGGISKISEEQYLLKKKENGPPPSTPSRRDSRQDEILRVMPEYKPGLKEKPVGDAGPAGAVDPVPAALPKPQLSPIQQHLAAKAAGKKAQGYRPATGKASKAETKSAEQPELS